MNVNNQNEVELACLVDVLYYLLDDLQCICGVNATVKAFGDGVVSRLRTTLDDKSRSIESRLKSVKELKSEIHAFAKSDEGLRLRSEVKRNRTVLNNPNYKPNIEPESDIVVLRCRI